jgi:hypothetical protein
MLAVLSISSEHVPASFLEKFGIRRKYFAGILQTKFVTKKQKYKRIFQTHFLGISSEESPGGIRIHTHFLVEALSTAD